MAKIQTETIVLTFNRLIKDTDVESAIIAPETVLSLEQVAQELAGPGVIVELLQA